MLYPYGNSGRQRGSKGPIPFPTDNSHPGYALDCVHCRATQGARSRVGWLGGYKSRVKPNDVTWHEPQEFRAGRRRITSGILFLFVVAQRRQPVPRLVPGFPDAASCRSRRRHGAQRDVIRHVRTRSNVMLRGWRKRRREAPGTCYRRHTS